MSTEQRKLEHIMICLQHQVQHDKANGFERVRLIPGEADGTPSTSTELLGKHLSIPLMIEAMTGGADGTETINRNLAIAAERAGIGMGVGSQRAALENPDMARTFKVRDVAPNILLFGNLGMAQVASYPATAMKEAVDMIGADALAIHINPTHEAAQPEGDDAVGIIGGVLSRIKEAKKMGLNVVVKEVGFGIPAELAIRLERAGADAIDVAGAGGTSWVKIEQLRGSKDAKYLLGEGIPTADALLQCSAALKVPLIASGGIRTGEEIAKSIAVGATIAGAAMPFLKPATESPEAVGAVIERMALELREAMEYTGARTLAEIKGRYRLV